VEFAKEQGLSFWKKNKQKGFQND